MKIKPGTHMSIIYRYAYMCIMYRPLLSPTHFIHPVHVNYDLIW